MQIINDLLDLHLEQLTALIATQDKMQRAWDDIRPTPKGTLEDYINYKMRSLYQKAQSSSPSTWEDPNQSPIKELNSNPG